MRRGDQLWYFDAPQDAWSNLAGQEGFAVVRKGATDSSSTHPYELMARAIAGGIGFFPL
jgi:hypothetical protein